MNMSVTFKNKTMPLRHEIVKLIAPSLYSNSDNGARPMAIFLNKRFPNKALTGAEIGVWKGEHASELLDFLFLKQLYLVDSYLGFQEEQFLCTQKEADQIYNNTLKLFLFG